MSEVEVRTVRAWWTCEPCEATISIDVTSNVEAFQPGGAADEMLAAIDEAQNYFHGEGAAGHKLESGRADVGRLPL